MADRTPTPVAQTANETEAAAAAAEQTTDTAAEGTADAAPVEEGTIPARILVDHLGFKANTLAMLTEAEAAICEGWADLEEAAVEFVKSLAD
jgi:hypothetical protein